MNPQKVKICSECCAENCLDHDEYVIEFKCERCQDVYETQLGATRCCANAFQPMPSTCFAKETKKRNKNEEYPANALKGRRDK